MKCGVFSGRRFFALVGCGLGVLPAFVRAQGAGEKVERVIDVSPVWSGHRVGFALLTHGRRQFTTFYDDQQRMTVAARSLGQTSWQLVRLPQKIGWDSHNYIAMTVDDDGHIHLSGNMHCVPLIYFRTSKPLAIETFERIPKMIGREEKKCTYPKFLRGARNELLFTYRDGSSGNGNQIWNVYDVKSRRWVRLLDAPLFDGQGKMNAYFTGPVRDKAGMFHVCWVWRDTPDCATNHDLCYARSKDLVHWETSAGKPLRLPITLETAEVVDPVPPGGGMINGNTKLGFDRQGRVILSYHKFDANGKTQIYNGRREAGGWKIYQTSDWDYRWEFSGGGAIRFEIGVGSVRAASGETLSQSYRHPKAGSGAWRLDAATLKPIGNVLSRGSSYPRSLRRVESSFPGMEVRWCGDSGSSGEKNVRYVLRWESLGENRDRPRKGPLPEPSMLRLYKLRTGR